MDLYFFQKYNKNVKFKNNKIFFYNKDFKN
jgi:hypothetical protein